jgi:hypothetical protein
VTIDNKSTTNPHTQDGSPDNIFPRPLGRAEERGLRRAGEQQPSAEEAGRLHSVFRRRQCFRIPVCTLSVMITTLYLTPSQRPDPRKRLVKTILLRRRHLTSHPVRRRAGAKVEQRARRLYSSCMCDCSTYTHAHTNNTFSSRQHYAHAPSESSTPHEAKKTLSSPDPYPATSSCCTPRSPKHPFVASPQQTCPTSSAYLASSSAPAHSPPRLQASTYNAEIAAM